MTKEWVREENRERMSVERVENETMMSRMNEFALKYSIDEEGKREMLKMLNESLSMIGEGILRSVKVKNSNEIKEKKEKLEGVKRYKSRKAEEYAEEHGIEIREFEMLEISKKDVENLIRSKTKKETEKESKVSKSEKKEVIKKERVICSGISKKGESCKSTGTISPEGAKKKYCFRHAEDWKSFECESDSSESEKEEEEKELKEEEYE